jgi:para-nitrobenzyl esterase
MRQIPADRVLAVQTETQVGASVTGVRINGPIVDGLSIPLNKAEALGAKAFNAVPLIAGSNGGDMDQGMSPITKATTKAEYEALVKSSYGAAANEVLKRFPVKADADVPATAKALASFGGMMGSNRQCAVLNAAHSSQPTYLYRYDRKHPYAPNAVIADQDIKTIGAYHTADIPYWFGTQDAFNSLRHTRDWQPVDWQLSTTMMEALIAFANTGAPGSKALTWPAWSTKDEAYVTFDSAVTVKHLDGKTMDYLVTHAATPTPPPAPNPARPRD